MKLTTTDQTFDIQPTTPTHQTFDIQSTTSTHQTFDVQSTTPTQQTDLSRDIRLQAQTLRDIGGKYSSIAEFLKISLRQVQYACTHRSTPQKLLCGRKTTIDAASRQILVDFVCASRENRQLPYWRIPGELQWNVSEDAIRWALKKEGFSRRIARRKPPISEANRLLRLAGAHEHVNWIKEQWETILGSDETGVNGSRHKKIYVIRRPHEEYDLTCIIPRHPGKGGGMFGACFSKKKKGSCVFGEKDGGKINKESYAEHIIPVIDDWMKLNPGLLFMQNNALEHAAKYIKEELQERNISYIFGPSYSPDLNSIERVGDIMKDGIQEHYDDQDKLFYNTLRKAVREAGDAVTPEQLEELIDEMHDRCKAVIIAEGKHTKY